MKKHRNALVSIIMPCYNAGDYIEYAINSVLQQKARVQLIVIDDGSTDATPTVLEKFRGHIELIKGDHAGVAHARNMAIPVVEGEYTILLDADDCFQPGAVSVLLDNISGIREVIYGAFSSWNQSMADCIYTHKPPVLRPDPFHYLSRNNYSPPGSILFPSVAFSEVGDFDQGVAGCEDWDFLLRLARSGYRFKRIFNNVLKYRRHFGSASNQANQMCRAGCKVIGRAFRPEHRISTDRYPDGNCEDIQEQVIADYCAGCIALALLGEQVDDARDMLIKAQLTDGIDAVSFGRSFRTALWWHSLSLPVDREQAIRSVQASAAVLFRDVPVEKKLADCMLRAMLYPELLPLLTRPGPKKAVRIFNEWKFAKNLIHNDR